MTIKRVLALGFFDGVHRGHASILQEACRLAAELGAESGAVTFESHPRALVLGRAPDLITSFSRRCELIRQAGVKQVYALPFDQKMANTSPEEFATILRDRFGAVAVVCGENFRFGKNAAGTPAFLEEFGLRVHVCKPVYSGKELVSSTRIRNCVREGHVHRAAQLLGRPFSMEGPVVSGYQVGRKLGFPTINVKPLAGGLIPRRGVYVTDVVIGGNLYRAVTNVGTRPTFTDADIVSIESHLLTFQGDLYGEEAEVRFLRYLRPERSFENGEALRAQIAADIEEARKTK